MLVDLFVIWHVVVHFLVSHRVHDVLEVLDELRNQLNDVKMDRLFIPNEWLRNP